MRIVSDLTLTKKVNKHISQMLDKFFSIMLPRLPLQSSNNLNIKHGSKVIMLLVLLTTLWPPSEQMQRWTSSVVVTLNPAQVVTK